MSSQKFGPASRWLTTIDIDVSGQRNSVAFSADGDWFYCVQEGAVLKLSVSSFAVVATCLLPEVNSGEGIGLAYIAGIALTPDDNTLYVSTFGLLASRNVFGGEDYPVLFAIDTALMTTVSSCPPETISSLMAGEWGFDGSIQLSGLLLTTVESVGWDIPIGSLLFSACIGENWTNGLSYAFAINPSDYSVISTVGPFIDYLGAPFPYPVSEPSIWCQADDGQIYVADGNGGEGSDGYFYQGTVWLMNDSPSPIGPASVLDVVPYNDGVLVAAGGVESFSGFSAWPEDEDAGVYYLTTSGRSEVVPSSVLTPAFPQASGICVIDDIFWLIATSNDEEDIEPVLFMWNQIESEVRSTSFHIPADLVSNIYTSIFLSVDKTLLFLFGRTGGIVVLASSTAPPTRQYPRDDQLGIGSARIRLGKASPPRSTQYSTRVGHRGTYS
jgi:hypothetical protein